MLELHSPHTREMVREQNADLTVFVGLDGEMVGADDLFGVLELSSFHSDHLIVIIGPLLHVFLKGGKLVDSTFEVHLGVS